MTAAIIQFPHPSIRSEDVAFFVDLRQRNLPWETRHQAEITVRQTLSDILRRSAPPKRTEPRL